MEKTPPYHSRHHASSIEFAINRTFDLVRVVTPGTKARKTINQNDKLTKKLIIVFVSDITV